MPAFKIVVQHQEMSCPVDMQLKTKKPIPKKLSADFQIFIKLKKTGF